MAAEDDIAAIDDGGENTAAEVRTALTSVLDRGDTLKLLAREVAGVGGASEFDFASLSQDFEVLRIIVWGRSEAAVDQDEVAVQFNGDTGANYARVRIQADNTDTTAAAGGGTGQTQGLLNSLAGANVSAGRAGHFEAVIPAYARTDFEKTFTTFGTYWNGSEFFERIRGGIWGDTAAINRVRLFLNSGSDFAEGTVASVYGMA